MMKLNEVMSILEENSNQSRKKSLIKAGASENTFGVLLGFLRKFASKIGINHNLALELWHTKNTDARLLAVMLFDKEKLNATDVHQLILDVEFDQILDDLMFRVGIGIDTLDELSNILLKDPKDIVQRAYWIIKLEQVKSKKIDDKALDDILEVIKQKLKDSQPYTQWMMNRCFAQIGISHPNYRSQVIELAEKLGVYKDMKVQPGCTSAYVPYWIAAVIK